MADDDPKAGEFDLFGIGSGRVLKTHPPTACEGETCCLHNPSDHHMRSFRQFWRDDRGLMERICPHGVGHPDPDDLDFKRRTKGDEFAGWSSVHGCCGERCCRKPGNDK